MENGKWEEIKIKAVGKNVKVGKREKGRWKIGEDNQAIKNEGGEEYQEEYPPLDEY